MFVAINYTTKEAYEWLKQDTDLYPIIAELCKTLPPDKLAEWIKDELDDTDFQHRSGIDYHLIALMFIPDGVWDAI